MMLEYPEIVDQGVHNLMLHEEEMILAVEAEAEAVGVKFGFE